MTISGDSQVGHSDCLFMLTLCESVIPTCPLLTMSDNTIRHRNVSCGRPSGNILFDHVNKHVGPGRALYCVCVCVGPQITNRRERFVTSALLRPQTLTANNSLGQLPKGICN
jgi:hypothetical protein